MAKTLLRLILLMLIAWSPGISGQTRTEKTIHKEFYPNGKLLRLTKVKITRNATSDIFNFYKRTLVHTTEFYPNGNKRLTRKNIRKIGSSGRPCYEVLDEITEYSAEGNISRKEIIKCDKGICIVKEYDEKGKIVFTRVNIRKQ